MTSLSLNTYKPLVLEPKKIHSPQQPNEKPKDKVTNSVGKNFNDNFFNIYKPSLKPPVKEPKNPNNGVCDIYLNNLRKKEIQDQKSKDGNYLKDKEKYNVHLPKITKADVYKFIDDNYSNIDFNKLLNEINDKEMQEKVRQFWHSYLFNAHLFLKQS